MITTASGRGVWRRAFPEWQSVPRRVRVLDSDPRGQTDVGITSWDSLARLGPAINKRPDLIILDEHHRASNPEAQRTQHVFGRMVDGGREMATSGAIVHPGDRVWQLSGTPAPHDPGNLWAPMRAGCPERLRPDVLTYDAFRSRYCVMGQKKLSNGRRIPIVLGGRNETELRQRLEGTFMRRTQADVGIRPPRYEMMPLIVSKAEQERIASEAPREDRILAAAAEGSTRDLDIELGTLRRLTGTIKAGAVVQAAREEFDNGLQKLVIAYWHRDVGDSLRTGLHDRGVVGIDGSSSAREREEAEAKFRSPDCRVFLAQIEAAGEAIDLSPSDELWIAEYPTSPRQMDQVSKRITNVVKARNVFIRVCCIEGSIDERLGETLARLWNSIREVIKS